MVIQMRQILKKISQTILVLSLVGLGVIVFSCASNKYQAKQLADADIETLQNLWLESSSYGDRHKIVQEFERRKSLDGLEFCLVWVTYRHSGKSAQSQYHPGASFSNSKYYPGIGWRGTESRKPHNQIL